MNGRMINMDHCKKKSHDRNQDQYIQNTWLNRYSLLLLALLTLCWTIPLNNAEAQALYAPKEPIDSPIINKEVDSQQYTTPEEKKLLKNKQKTIQTIQNAGIKAGLYFEGLENENDRDQSISTLHFNKFCDKASVSEGGNGWKDCQPDPLNAMGDIKLSTLLSSNMLQDDYRKTAVNVFLQNLIDPNPSQKFAQHKLLNASNDPNPFKDPQIRKELAKNIISQTLLSVAREPFAEMIAKRTPIDMQVPDPKGTKNPDGTNAMVTVKMSMMQKMEDQANQRFLNQKWYDELAANKKFIVDYLAATKQKKPDYVVTGLLPLYDIAAMDAYRTWLEFERYKQGERIEALLTGVIVAIDRQTKATAEVLAQQTKPSFTTPTTAP